MRTIKFRGKDFLGRWHYGHLHLATGSSSLMIQVDSFDSFGVLPETVGQFTGLLDKNGKEVYEGDIVRKKEIGGYGCEYIGVVRYYEKDCRFGIDLTATNKFSKRGLFTDGEVQAYDGHCTITYTLEYEVLGNVFDNHNLMEGGTE